jgi:hypothetical protein
VRPMTG